MAREDPRGESVTRNPIALQRRQNVVVRGGMVTTEALLIEETTVDVDEVEELLVEEVSIDGLCGVY